MNTIFIEDFDVSLYTSLITDRTTDREYLLLRLSQWKDEHTLIAATYIFVEYKKRMSRKEMLKFLSDRELLLQLITLPKGTKMSFSYTKTYCIHQ